MLDALRFVKGAVSKTDLIPLRTFFEIRDGFISAYTGFMSLKSPINLDLSAKPKAAPFIKAIEACQDETALYMTKAGRLAVKSGSFKAFIDCTIDPFPEAIPQGEMVELRPGFVDAMKKLVPFIGQNTTKPWANGLLFRGQSAFATNNAILAEYWLKHSFPYEVNIPYETVRELIRINEDPIAIQVGQNNITFHYEGDRWLYSVLSALGWPDLAPMLDQKSEQQRFPDGFFDALEKLKPFVIELDRVYFRPGQIQTAPNENEGAVIKIDGLPSQGCYQIKHLLLLKDMADTADFSRYPKPCLFFGENFRGAVAGMYE